MPLISAFEVGLRTQAQTKPVNLMASRRLMRFPAKAPVREFFSIVGKDFAEAYRESLHHSEMRDNHGVAG